MSEVQFYPGHPVEEEHGAQAQEEAWPCPVRKALRKEGQALGRRHSRDRREHGPVWDTNLRGYPACVSGSLVQRKSSKHLGGSSGVDAGNKSEGRGATLFWGVAGLLGRGVV